MGWSSPAVIVSLAVGSAGLLLSCVSLLLQWRLQTTRLRLSLVGVDYSSGSPQLEEKFHAFHPLAIRIANTGHVPVTIERIIARATVPSKIDIVLREGVAVDGRELPIKLESKASAAISFADMDMFDMASRGIRRISIVSAAGKKFHLSQRHLTSVKVIAQIKKKNKKKRSVEYVARPDEEPERVEGDS